MSYIEKLQNTIKRNKVCKFIYSKSWIAVIGMSAVVCAIIIICMKLISQHINMSDLVYRIILYILSMIDGSVFGIIKSLGDAQNEC